MVHQKKGGIHDIYSIITEAFGYFRVTGLLCCNNLGHRPGQPNTFGGLLFTAGLLKYLLIQQV